MEEIECSGDRNKQAKCAIQEHKQDMTGQIDKVPNLVYLPFIRKDDIKTNLNRMNKVITPDHHRVNEDYPISSGALGFHWKFCEFQGRTWVFS
jgi:hypothetical protein